MWLPSTLKGLTLKSPPPPPLHPAKPHLPLPLLLLICRINGESTLRRSGKVCPSFCIQPPSSSSPPLQPCSLSTHSTRLCFLVKRTGSNVPCSQQQLLLDLAILQHKRGERAEVSLHLCLGPLLSFSALCVHWWGRRRVGCSFFFFFLFCQSFVLVWVCSGWRCGTGTFSHLIFLLCSIQGYGPLLCHSNLASNLHYYINYDGFGLISVLKFCHVVCKAKCIHSNSPCWTSSSWARPSRASTLNGETDPCFGNSWQRFSSLSPLYLNKLQRWTKQIISLSSYLLINTLVTRKMKLSCKQMYFHWFLINL